MRKILLFTLALCAMLMTSCKKESYYHTMNLAYPTGGVGKIFADQDLDSVFFYTTDDFQVTSNTSWATVPSDKGAGDVPYTYQYVWGVTVPVYFEANTTGKVRTANLTIRSWGEDDWDNTMNAVFIQASWLNITRPAPKYSYLDSDITGAAFEMKDSIQTTDSLTFQVWNNWTLTDGSFVHPAITSGPEGVHTVILTLDANTTAVERKDTLVLTSNGVSNKIAFTQAPKKNE